MDIVDGNCSGKIKNKNETATDIENPTNRDQNSNAVSRRKEITAVMPVSKNSPYYNMSHRKRGLLYIFNHDRYYGNKHDPRSGTNQDCRKIKECFNNLDFEVNVLDNLRLLDIQKHVSEVSQMDHSDHDCIVIFVLSHGDKNRLLAYDHYYDPEEVFWGQFTGDKCRTLAGKPKLFFIQSCLGEKFDDGVKLIVPNSVRRTETDGAMLAYKIPVLADFLIVFSTSPECVAGHYAFRNTENGSYFITVLCEELNKNAYKCDIQTILTFVNQRVSIEFESNSKREEHNKKKQAPHFQSSLTRLLQFHKKPDEFDF